MATNGTVTLNPNGTVTFTPTANYYAGPASFIYRVKDATGATSANTATVSLTITPVNNTAPTAVADGPFTITKNTARTFTANELVGNDTDPDLPNGDTLSVYQVGGPPTAPSNSTPTAPSPSPPPPTTTPAPPRSSTASKTPPDHQRQHRHRQPHHHPGQQHRPHRGGRRTVHHHPEDTARTFTANELVGNDTDPDLPNGDTLSVYQVGVATNGTVQLNPDGTVTFTPTANYYAGPASFIYRVKDATGATSANHRHRQPHHHPGQQHRPHRGGRRTVHHHRRHRAHVHR